MKIDFARELCVKILYEIEVKKAYSNIILDEYLNKNREKITNKDAAFISEIVRGTVIWRLTIDNIIQNYSKIKINKISKWIIQILRISVYQIIFLDKVPKSAAVNEGVNLSKKYGNKSSGFVNAILRKIEKSDYEELKEIKDDIKRISLVYSMPEWIVKRLIKQYGEKETEKICLNSTLKPKTTIRINNLKINRDEFIKKLDELDIEYEKTEHENFINIKTQNIGNMELFKKGYFTVQDESAGLIAVVLAPKEKEMILDACAAPGGKTTHLAELMNNKGYIEAWDFYEHRINKIEENAKRLGVNMIKTKVQDATKLKEDYYEKFDKILLDVPCMGLGVIKRKPDIKWERKEEQIKEISKIQYEILKICSKYLKKNGELVYSTCSILKEENEDVIKKFLDEENFVIKCRKNDEKEIYNILPDANKDGFFICKLVKK